MEDQRDLEEEAPNEQDYHYWDLEVIQCEAMMPGGSLIEHTLKCSKFNNLWHFPGKMARLSVEEW